MAWILHTVADLIRALGKEPDEIQHVDPNHYALVSQLDDILIDAYRDQGLDVEAHWVPERYIEANWQFELRKKSTGFWALHGAKRNGRRVREPPEQWPQKAKDYILFDLPEHVREKAYLRAVELEGGEARKPGDIWTSETVRIKTPSPKKVLRITGTVYWSDDEDEDVLESFDFRLPVDAKVAVRQINNALKAAGFYYEYEPDLFPEPNLPGDEATLRIE